jgi:hypothetical protein
MTKEYSKMHSLITIIGVVLTSLENYREWYRKIKRTSIFNDFSNGICEATPFSEKEFESVESKTQSKCSKLTIPTSNRKCSIWKDKE